MKILLKISYVGLILLFFYIPIGILIINSVNQAQYSLIWQGFSWQWYQQLFAQTAIWTTLINSLILALTAATIATGLGTLISIAITRYKFPGRKFLRINIYSLIILPDIILGISLLILYNLFQLSLGFVSLLLAHITFCLPFVVITLLGRLEQLETAMLEAAKDLGANDWQIFRKIILPLIWPGVLAGFLLSFTLSLDDIMVSYFVSGPSFEILPLKIYSMVRTGINPEINALCTVTFLLTLSIVIIAQWLLAKK